jgi:hypothetical protein
MEPNRLDNEFKAKLDQRTIQPSSMAWDRLDAMLSVGEEKKKKPKRTWLYIAASFLGFLLAVTLFFKQQEAPKGIINSNNQVVNNEVPEVTQDAQPAGDSKTVTSPSPVSTKTGSRVASAVPARAQVISPDPISPVVAPAGINDAVAATDENKQQVVQGPEADNLMAASFTESPLKKKTSIKVDPNSLLSSVEGELDTSFKNKALQGAIKNFNTVRSSLANRNHK